MSRHNKKMKCKEMRLARNVLSLCHHFSVDFQEKWDDIEAQAPDEKNETKCQKKSNKCAAEKYYEKNEYVKRCVRCLSFFFLFNFWVSNFDDPL